MKLTVLLTAALVAAVAPAARADEKSDAILKEVALRAANLTTYSVTMEMHEGKKVGRIAIYMRRPDKFRLEIQEGDTTQIMVLDGDRAAVAEGENMIPIPAKDLKKVVREMVGVSLGNVGQLLGGVTKTTYVTQKMLDETTVVDVIDIVGSKLNPSDKGRLYIDNNGQIRKVAGFDKNRSSYILFLNPQADEPIPDEKFAIPKEK